MDASVNGWIVLIPLVVAAFVALTAIKHVEEGNRLVIERFGRYLRIGGPGRHFLLPYIDHGIKVDLHQELPSWQGMTEQEIEKNVLRKRYGAA